MVRSLAIVALMGCGAFLAREDARSWGPPQELCFLKSDEVNESSGVAASQIQGGVYFTHNDSGDSARFFRFARTGTVDGVYSLKGVQAVDWEDMSSATVDGKPYLYFGDVGDNGEVRKSVTVYKVPEPKEGGKAELSEFETYKVTYPDKAHNCEALFVTRTGDVWVVTKNAGGVSSVFVLSKPKGSGSYVFRKIGTMNVDTAGFGGKFVTGGDVSPDGKFVVLRTYSAALEFAVPDSFEDWHKSKPLTVRTALETQGEAICYSRDGRYLVTTSEYAPCPVSVVPLKGP